MAQRRQRCLFATWDGGGNVPPMLGLGRWWTGAGHVAGVAGPASLQAGARAAGLELLACSAVDPWPDGVPFEDDLHRFSFIRDSAEVAHDLMRTIKDFGPDVVVADCTMGAAFAAAEASGVPTVALVHVLLRPYVAVWGSMFVDGGPARAALGLQALDSTGPAEMLDRAAKVLACTPEELDVPGPPVLPQAHYVGPILDPGPAGLAVSPEDGPDPLVLISFSSTAMWQERALPPVIDAVATLQVRGLLTLGDIPVAGLPTAPNVTVHQYLAHRDVLGRTAVVVNHGGLSTVLAALAHGVPMVCIRRAGTRG